MSFLVSFNGQFSPYLHPVKDVRDDRITPVHQLEALNAQEVGHQIPDVETAHHPPHPELSAYQKQVTTFKQTKKRVYARDIMSAPAHSVQKSSSVSEAIATMKKFGFRHLPVVDPSDHLVGILSERELVEAKAISLCSQLMIPKVIVALQSARIQEIAHIMLQEKINALPIVNDQHRIVGIITQSDILKYIIHNEEFLEFG